MVKSKWKAHDLSGAKSHAATWLPDSVWVKLRASFYKRYVNANLSANIARVGFFNLSQLENALFLQDATKVDDRSSHMSYTQAGAILQWEVPRNWDQIDDYYNQYRIGHHRQWLKFTNTDSTHGVIIFIKICYPNKHLVNDD